MFIDGLEEGLSEVQGMRVKAEESGGAREEAMRIADGDRQNARDVPEVMEVMIQSPLRNVKGRIRHARRIRHASAPRRGDVAESLLWWLKVVRRRLSR